MQFLFAIFLAHATVILNHAAPTENNTTSVREKIKIRLPWTFIGLSLLGGNSDDDEYDDDSGVADSELQRRINKVIDNYENEKNKAFLDLVFGRNRSVVQSEKNVESVRVTFHDLVFGRNTSVVQSEKNVGSARVKRNVISAASKKAGFIKPTIAYLFMKLEKKFYDVYNSYMGGVNKTHSKTRPKRSFFRRLGTRLAKVGKGTKKFEKKALKFTAIWSIASAGGKYAELMVNHEWNKHHNHPVERDCEKDRYGCVNSMCWTSCGPRLTSQDFCLITYNVPKNKSEPVQFIKCDNDKDCTNCLPCGSSCAMIEDDGDDDDDEENVN